MNEVLWENDAVNQLMELHGSDPRQARRIRDAILRYQREGHGDIKRLVGRTDELRLRVGIEAFFAVRPPGS